jgi:transcription termination factor Rho
MSESSADFDRSQLDGKDREQLVVIATTLGRKPPSRAKKAEIVDLILELAGVSSAGSATSTADRAAPEDASATTGSESNATASGTRDTANGPADESTRVKRGGGRTSAGSNIAGGTGDGDGTSSRNGSNSDGSNRSATNGNASSGGADDGDQDGGKDASSDDAASTSSADRTNDAQDHAGQGDDGQGGQGQGESGNRRRRRRGRDRDRGPAQANPGDPAPEGDPVEVDGILDLRDDGYGFLRLHGYLAHRDDSYVSVKQVRQFGLRKGDRIKGLSRPPARAEKNPALLRIDQVNGAEPSLARERPHFEDLTPLYPDEPLRLEHPDTIVDMTPRIIDLVAPIGKGQRGLIVSPPKSGNTSILNTIARALHQNKPDLDHKVKLVDERPEEVTDFERWVRDGEVAASTFDRPSEEHTTIADLVIERAKRIVEAGGDVVVLVDGITRLTRAYNLTVQASGRLMSGGIDAAAIYPPKKFFGAARNVEDGGSLTILATALVDTNSRMDDHIFEEFKGTGNMELRLDRRLAERRIFPAIDIAGSGTRHEELLFTKPQLNNIYKLRRVLAGVGGESGSNAAAMELLIERMQAFKSNEAFLAEVGRSTA